MKTKNSDVNQINIRHEYQALLFRLLNFESDLNSYVLLEWMVKCFVFWSILACKICVPLGSVTNFTRLASSSFGVKTANPRVLDYRRCFKFLLYPEKTLLVSLIIKPVVFVPLEQLCFLFSSRLCWQVWYRRDITSIVRVILLLSISAAAFTTVK